MVVCIRGSYKKMVVSACRLDEMWSFIGKKAKTLILLKNCLKH